MHHARGLKAVASGLIALLIGGAGGMVFYILHLPLPWTLGSISATATVAAIGAPWRMPRAAQSVAMPIVGVIAGSAFTPAVISSATQWWDAILLVTIFSAAITGLGYAYFRAIGRFDQPTAFFASSPGGLGEMTLLGGSLGGDMRSLVLVHSARILLAVFLIPLILQVLLGHPVGRVSPFAATASTLSYADATLLIFCAIGGFALSRILRYPTGALVLSLALSAAIHGTGLSSATPPPWVSAAMQVLIGAVAGARFADVGWHGTTRIVSVALIWGCTIVAIVIGAATLSSWLLDHTFVVMLLAMAPGGMVEMTVMTFALGVEVALVVTCQIVRILMVVTLMPPTYRLLFPPKRDANGDRIQ